MEKEKLLTIINFSFSHSFFKRLVLKTCKNKGLFGIRLTLSQTSPGFYMSEVQVFKKTLWEKEKLLLVFPQCFSTHLDDFLPFS